MKRQMVRVTKRERTGGKLSGRLCFLRRIEAEGRLDEFHRLVKAVQVERRAAGGVDHWQQSSQEAMRRMGYLGTELERDRENDRKLAKSNEEAEAEFEDCEEMAARYEVVVGSLPAEAKLDVELLWISTHPAINRKTRRSEDEIGPILLSIDDVLDSPAGAAPSQRAVRQLQHWSNSPMEFQKMLLGVQKAEIGKQKEAVKPKKKVKERVEDAATKRAKEIQKQWEDGK